MNEKQIKKINENVRDMNLLNQNVNNHGNFNQVSLII
jgi:hypothetical protein